jgi:hypothetical protein
MIRHGPYGITVTRDARWLVKRHASLLCFENRTGNRSMKADAIAQLNLLEGVVLAAGTTELSGSRQSLRNIPKPFYP